MKLFISCSIEHNLSNELTFCNHIEFNLMDVTEQNSINNVQIYKYVYVFNILSLKFNHMIICN